MRLENESNVLTSKNTLKKALLLFDNIGIWAQDIKDFTKTIEPICDNRFKDARFSAFIIDNPYELNDNFKRDYVFLFDESDNLPDLKHSDIQSKHSLIYTAILQSIPVIIEDKTSWDQTEEFRKDKEALWKYRKLRNWIRDGLEVESISHAQDLIEEKIDHYAWSIKKHGFNIVKGTIYSIIDPKKLSISLGAGFSSKIVAGDTWGIITAGIVLGSTACIKLIDNILSWQEVKKGNNSEVALIYDIKKKFKSEANNFMERDAE